MNVWLMKTYHGWGELFLKGPSFVAIDEEGIDIDYGSLDSSQRINLFSRLQKLNNASIQYGLVKRFFDEFYDIMEIGDIIILGTGQRTLFNVSAALRVTSAAHYKKSAPTGEPRHCRDVEVLWQGEPFPVQEWGFARRLELLNTVERYKELAQVLVRLM